jgi:hypothetical protein
MDLLRLLQIDSSLIGPEARESLLLADRIWREAGAPREMWALVAALEEILRRCKESGIWYAPILLQRKKALERGTWRVPQEFRSVSLPAALPAKSSATASCCKCGDTGILCAPGGSRGTLCGCGAYLRKFVKTA